MKNQQEIKEMQETMEKVCEILNSGQISLDED